MTGKTKRTEPAGNEENRRPETPTKEGRKPGPGLETKKE